MIRFDPNSNNSLYEQLYQQIRDDILTGRLKKDAPLQSLRVLEEELGVSRTTVGRAYQQLVAEGYVRSVHGAGYFVEDINAVFTTKRSAPEQALHLKQATSLEQIYQIKYDFDYKGIEPRLFPWNKWQKAVNNAIDYDAFQKRTPITSPNGCGRLRESLADFLYHHRGVISSPEQIVVCTDMRYAMDIVLSVLNPKIHRMAFEEPGSGSMRSFIEGRGFDVVSVPVTREGLLLEALEMSNCNVAYTTPSSQFPTGATMPLDDRSQLLQWANNNDAYIIENDQYCHFHNEGSPVPSLQSLDMFQRVIYLGSLSRVLPNSISCAYLVLPPPLLDAYKEKFSTMKPMLPNYHELALAQFFEDSVMERHIRRMKVINEKKLELLGNCIVDLMSRSVSLLNISSAARALVRIEECEDQKRLLLKLEDADIRIYGMKPHCHDITRFCESIFIMGFNSLNEEDLVIGCEQMSSILNNDFS